MNTACTLNILPCRPTNPRINEAYYHGNVLRVWNGFSWSDSEEVPMPEDICTEEGHKGDILLKNGKYMSFYDLREKLEEAIKTYKTNLIAVDRVIESFLEENVAQEWHFLSKTKRDVEKRLCLSLTIFIKLRHSQLYKGISSTVPF